MFRQPYKNKNNTEIQKTKNLHLKKHSKKIRDHKYMMITRKKRKKMNMSIVIQKTIDQLTKLKQAENE